MDKKGNSARDAVVSMVKRLLGIVCRERQQYKALIFPFFSTINKQARVGQRVIVLRSYHIETGVCGKSRAKPGLRNSDPPSKVKGGK